MQQMVPGQGDYRSVQQLIPDSRKRVKPNLKHKHSLEAIFKVTKPQCLTDYLANVSDVFCFLEERPVDHIQYIHKSVEENKQMLVEQGECIEQMKDTVQKIFKRSQHQDTDTMV